MEEGSGLTAAKLCVTDKFRVVVIDFSCIYPLMTSWNRGKVIGIYYIHGRKTESSNPKQRLELTIAQRGRVKLIWQTNEVKFNARDEVSRRIRLYVKAVANRHLLS